MREPERSRLVRDGVPLFALIDGDQLWRPLKLPREASDAQFVDAIFGGPSPDRVGVFVLRDNMETVCSALLECGFTSSSWSPERDGKPSITERDKLLVRAAENWTAAGRERVLLRVPALGALVEALVAVIAA